jgi:hypothetical protein
MAFCFIFTIPRSFLFSFFSARDQAFLNAHPEMSGSIANDPAKRRQSIVGDKVRCSTRRFLNSASHDN